MTKKDILTILKKNLLAMNDAKKWLERSYQICQKIDLQKEFTAVDYDSFENLVSRFARTVDLLINKVFRSIDRVELEDAGTTIDVVNRASKRGLIESPEEARILKELRNEIAHEYTSRELKDLFSDIFKTTPKLLTMIAKTNSYCENKYHG
jgi:hypothetical protein